MGNSIFLGCMFLGIGIGLYFGEAGIGVLIGLGVGFIIRGFYSKKENN